MSAMAPIQRPSALLSGIIARTLARLRAEAMARTFLRAKSRNKFGFRMGKNQNNTRKHTVQFDFGACPFFRVRLGWAGGVGGLNLEPLVLYGILFAVGLPVN